MIEAIVGVPGGGKSYWGVRRMMYYIAKGGVVVSNIRLSGTVDTGKTGLDRYDLAPDSHVRVWLREILKWEYQTGQYIFVDEEAFNGNWIACLPKGNPNKHVFLLLDEVNDIFDSLDKAKLTDKAYREMFAFLRLHRHYYVDCVFLLQDFSTLNARLRGLCQYVHKSVDMQGIRLAGIPFKSPFPVFAHFTYDKAGRVLLSKEYVTKEKGIFGLYESYCAHGNIRLCDAPFSVDFGDKGSLKRKVKKMSAFDRVLIVVGFGLVCLFVVMGRPEKAVAGAVAAPVVMRVVVTNTVQTVSDTTTLKEVKVKALCVVEYAPISYGSSGAGNSCNDVWAYAGGRVYRVGMLLPEGRVVQIEKWGIRILGDGGEKWIYHSDTYNGDSGNRANVENGQTSANIEKPDRQVVKAL